MWQISDASRGRTFDGWLRILRDRDPILDLGSGEHGGYSIATRGRRIRIDVQPRFRPEIVADAQGLPFQDSSFAAVRAMSVLEHVPRPWLAVEEIHRVLEPHGLAIGYVPYMYPYHADSSFHDYYRFSDEALRSLFEPFSSLEILRSGGYTNALLRFAAGFTASQRHVLRGERPLSAVLSSLARATGIWDSTRVRGLRRTTTGYNFLARK